MLEGINTEKLETLGVPYQLSREALRKDAQLTGRGATDYFQSGGKGKNHYTPLGNQVVFRVLEAWIADVTR